MTKAHSVTKSKNKRNSQGIKGLLTEGSLVNQSESKTENTKNKLKEITYDLDFDMSIITRNFDGDLEFFKEIFQIFLETYPNQIETIRRMILENNPESVEKAAHRLAGSLTNFNVSEIKETALKLEKMGKKKRLQGAKKQLSRLELQINEFVNYVERHVSQYIAEITN
jgi:HPt (histidine-containing phosphotransfer) domain-containing protein